MNSLSNNLQSFERRTGHDRRSKEIRIFNKYWLMGRRVEVRRKEDTHRLHSIDRHNAGTLAAVLLIIMLSVIDAFFTLHLIQRGAVELNPVMAYCLDFSPLTFFWVKYLLTGSAVLIILFVKNMYLFNSRFQVKYLFVIFLATYILVIQWELYLLFIS